uniref:Malectin-like domain-containing protein n=1 Tax=Nelumbo nucifera TaxID=4432 RepID=A0A822ZEB7_NELNU|nr:TPA_asm: hypothetical protein HUJ06_002754 [Nelumbo nucifera]
MKNCYALPIDGEGNTRYLVRAWFMYGNYDALNEVPKFDVYLGVNLWATVEFDNATHIRIYEIIHAPPVGYNTIDVCLLNTRSGTPFISVLELRNWLVNYRYPDDEYDRIWWPNSYSAWEPLITSLTVDSRDNNGYIPPSLVMRTVVTPANGSSNLRFSWEWENPSTQFYVYLHFAETQQLQESQSRKFYVYVGPDKIYNDALTLNYLSTTTLYNLSPLSGRGFLFDITQAGDMNKVSRGVGVGKLNS